MASAQFASTNFSSFKSTSGPYATLYTGFYNVDTASCNKFSHAYRGMVFFDAAAITAALANKVVDQIDVIIFPISDTRYNASADWAFWRTNLTSMPAAATNILAGLESDMVGDYFLEGMTQVNFSKSGGQQNGMIASGAAAQRLADALKSGCGMGLLYWVANGANIYTGSNSGLQHGGTTTAPVIVITYHDAYTQCTPPASVGVSATNVAPGAGVALSWPAGTPGTGMTVDHYDVYRSADGGASYQLLQSVWGTSVGVNAPAGNGASYLYKVVTVGTVAGYNSGLSSAYAVLTCSFSTPAITSISIDGGNEAYKKAGEYATLAWAAANGANNPITKYQIYRDGVYYTETTSTSLSVPAYGANGGGYTYTVYAIGTYSNSGASAGRVVYTYSDPSAPSAISVSASLANAGSNVALNWSGVGAGYFNAPRGYHVYRATAPDGPYSFLAEILTTDTSGSMQVAAHSTEGATYYYRAYTLGNRSNSAISSTYATLKTNSTPAAPNSLRFGIAGGSYFYNSLQCLWSNGGDADGNFTGVYIRLARYNHDSAYGTVGWDWLDTGWVWLGNVATISFTRAQLAAKGAKAGDALAFGLVSQDALSLQNWGAAGMTASGWLYLAADPTAPTTFAASPAIQESGVSLGWSGANGNGIVVAGYEIESKVASTAAGVDGTDGYAGAAGSPVTSSTTSGTKSDAAGITRGYFERWRIRTITAEGTKSTWMYSNVIQKNRVPVTPSMLFPATGRTTYNTQPYVGLSISAEPDGQTQTLYYSIDNGAAQNAGAVTAGTKKMRMPTLAAGSHTLRFWLQDGLGAASGEAAITITVAANTYTRAITGYVSDQQPGTLLWDEANALRTSTEILELKSRVNQIRAYYGLAAINLPYEGTSGIGTIKHFHTWAANMAAFKQGLADTCVVSGASVPVWVTRARNAPSAGVVNQIRAAVGGL